jgi:hypothetical protein
MAKTRYPELDLDLSFSPIACAEPRAFTQDQIRHYNSQGYVAGIPLFTGRRHPRPSVGLRRPDSSGRYTQGDSLRNLQYEWYHYRGQVTPPPVVLHTLLASTRFPSA